MVIHGMSIIPRPGLLLSLVHIFSLPITALTYLSLTFDPADK